MGMAMEEDADYMGFSEQGILQPFWISRGRGGGFEKVLKEGFI